MNRSYLHNIVYFKSKSGANYSYSSLDNQILFYPCNSIHNNYKKSDKKDNFVFFSPKTKEFYVPATDLLILNITENCNLRCRYCAYSGAYKYERTHSSSVMKKEIALKAIDLFLKREGNKPRRIGFYGGEPLLVWPQVKNIIDDTLKIDPSIIFSINTNLTLLTESMIQYFISHNVVLYVSLDGDKTIHDLNRVDSKGNGTFDKIAANLLKLFERSPDWYKSSVAFLCTMSRPYPFKNLQTLYEGSVLFKQPWNVTTIMPFDNTISNIDEIICTNRNYRKNLDELAESFINAAIQGKAIDHFGHWIFGRELKAIHLREMSPSNELYIHNCCIPGRNKLFVTCDGKFYPCEKCGDFMGLGDLSSGLNFSNAINIANEYKKDCEKRCYRCVNARFCNQCYLVARKGSQLDFSRRESVCKNRIYVLKKVLYIYTSILEQNENALDYLANEF